MNSGTLPVQKQEDGHDDKGDKKEAKPVVKTLNRVPRACNACRKQKMRCEGADNPPCRRCRNSGLECLFEKPSREATLTGEAGLERIRSLETHVAEIRQGQTSIQAALSDIQGILRSAAFQARSPSVYPPPQFHHQSPSVHSPSLSTPVVHHRESETQSPDTAHSYANPSHIVSAGQSSHSMRPMPEAYHPGPPPPGTQLSPTNEYHPPMIPPPLPQPGYAQQRFNVPSSYPHQQGPVLPPFSTIQSGTQQVPQANVSSIRFQQEDTRTSRSQRQPGSRGHSSQVTSADSSDAEDDGELPASGLVAPWEVLRGLADVAVERAARENGGPSEPNSRPRTPSPERQSRPTKRRKLRHRHSRPALMFPDVVTKGIINENEARELFRIFYHGCSTFLPVFDYKVDTYDALHERSPFAVDCICMVAARVKDGGGKPSQTYLKCLEEVQTISCATLFAPVARVEAVQAMILVSGWSDNGWLSGGHAVRMAMELSLHKAWPQLQQRILSGKADKNADRELVVQTRTWLCLYLYEHQLSYGTGRPAILKDDASITNCRALLQHPLAIEDDMRLVSTVELMAVRERVQNALSPMDSSINEQDIEELRHADIAFRSWFTTWDHVFSQKYEDAAFYRQSLQIQHIHAELFHNAFALRGIHGPEDVQRMPAALRDLAIRSIYIARQGLDITVNSPAYREGMKYAVHYTHVTATFTASFLLRLARLFPEQCDLQEIKDQVERLTVLMAEMPAKRYALTLQLMLKRFKKRKSASTSRSPHTVREPPRPMAVAMIDTAPVQAQQFSPVYEQHQFNPSDPGPPNQMMAGPMNMPPQFVYAQDAEHIWRGFETAPNEQLPVWISDQSLGGNTFQQHGMDAFLLPTDYLPTAQVW